MLPEQPLIDISYRQALIIAVTRLAGRRKLAIISWRNVDSSNAASWDA